MATKVITPLCGTSPSTLTASASSPVAMMDLFSAGEAHPRVDGSAQNVYSLAERGPSSVCRGQNMGLSAQALLIMPCDYILWIMT
jgi:hypothetical protein